MLNLFSIKMGSWAHFYSGWPGTEILLISSFQVVWIMVWASSGCVFQRLEKECRRNVKEASGHPRKQIIDADQAIAEATESDGQTER
jgi:hypothetical protein